MRKIKVTILCSMILKLSEQIKTLNPIPYGGGLLEPPPKVFFICSLNGLGSSYEIS